MIEVLGDVIIVYEAENFSGRLKSSGKKRQIGDQEECVVNA